MAWLQKRYKKDGSFVFHIVYKVRGKNITKSTKTSDERLASVILEKFKADLTLEKFGIKRAKKLDYDRENDNRIHLQDFISEYPKVRKDVRENTRIIDKYCLENLIDYTGNVYLDEINRATMKRYKSHRLESASSGTVDLEMRTLRAAFYYAKDAGYIIENPFSKYGKLKTEENDIPEFLEKNEIKRIRNTIDKNKDYEFRSFFEICLNIGGRRSEILNLEYKDINYKEKFLVLHHTKTGKARMVPMNEAVERTLKEKYGDKKEGKLFNYHEDTPTRKFKKYLKLSGIKKDLHLHNLRDTFASHLIMNGVDLLTVSKYMGNSVKIIEKHYGHLSPGHYRESIKKLSF